MAENNSNTPAYGAGAFKRSMPPPEKITAAARTNMARYLAAGLHRIGGTRLYNTLSGAVPAGVFFWFLLGEYYHLWLFFVETEPADMDTRFYAIVFTLLSKIVFLSLMIALFIIRRQPVRKAPGLLPRATALAGTFFMFLIVLIPASEPSLIQGIAGITLVGAGSILSAISLGYLGRSFSIMAEARHLVTSGPYSRIRHPLYLAEEVAVLGMVVQVFSIPIVLLVAVHITLQIQRMKNEEAVLRAAFPEYEPYMRRTHRVLPGLY